MSGVNFDSIFKELPKRELLRIDEVAVFMGVTKQTIRSWYPEKLQGTNVSGVIRIYRQSVIDLVVSNNGRKKSDETPEEVETKIKKAKPRPSTGPRSKWVNEW